MHRCVQRSIRPIGSKLLHAKNGLLYKPQQFLTRGFSTSDLEFKLADIGEGIAEVELMKWFVKVKKTSPFVYL